MGSEATHNRPRMLDGGESVLRRKVYKGKAQRSTVSFAFNILWEICLYAGEAQTTKSEFRTSE